MDSLKKGRELEFLVSPQYIGGIKGGNSTCVYTVEVGCVTAMQGFGSLREWLLAVTHHLYRCVKRCYNAPYNLSFTL
jgi:hypothetical protein